MNQNAAPTLQALLNELGRPGKLAKQILIVDIVDLHTTVLVLFPILEILEIFEVIAQD